MKKRCQQLLPRKNRLHYIYPTTFPRGLGRIAGRFGPPMNQGMSSAVITNLLMAWWYWPLRLIHHHLWTTSKLQDRQLELSCNHHQGHIRPQVLTGLVGLSVMGLSSVPCSSCCWSKSWRQKLHWVHAVSNIRNLTKRFPLLHPAPILLHLSNSADASMLELSVHMFPSSSNMRHISKTRRCLCQMWHAGSSCSQIYCFQICEFWKQ